MALSVWLLMERSPVPGGNEATRSDTVKPAADTNVGNAPAPLATTDTVKEALVARNEPSPLPSRIATWKRRVKEVHRVVARTEVASVSGRLDSWEDWNSSFSDTVMRTCSAIFDSARVDTLPGGSLGFAASGKQRDLVPVKDVFCRIDSVRKLVKYTFPGQGVDFIIGVGFHASVSFSGDLHPQERFCKLTFLKAPEDEDDPTGRLARNQLTLLLNSPPGYSYVLRVGIECPLLAEPASTTIYYTRPTVVEFRRMIRYQELLSDVSDTLLILTRNPKAMLELARAVPRSVVSGVLIPAGDTSGLSQLQSGAPKNLLLHFGTPRAFRESFLVLNESTALVEGKELDPDFKHILQLRRKDAPTDHVAYPHFTTLIQEKAQVAQLRLAFQAHLRSKP